MIADGVEVEAEADWDTLGFLGDKVLVLDSAISTLACSGNEMVLASAQYGRISRLACAQLFTLLTTSICPTGRRLQMYETTTLCREFAMTINYTLITQCSSNS